MYEARQRALQPLLEAQSKVRCSATSLTSHLSPLASHLTSHIQHNRERIHVREEEYQRRREEQVELERQRERAQQELEARLDALRRQVQVTAQADPARLVSHTVASRAAAVWRACPCMCVLCVMHAACWGGGARAHGAAHG